jgi:hypothetical protein
MKVHAEDDATDCSTHAGAMEGLGGHSSLLEAPAEVVEAWRLVKPALLELGRGPALVTGSAGSGTSVSDAAVSPPRETLERWRAAYDAMRVDAQVHAEGCTQA